jgi:hypothetical protein
MSRIPRALTITVLVALKEIKSWLSIGASSEIVLRNEDSANSSFFSSMVRFCTTRSRSSWLVIVLYNGGEGIIVASF